MNRHQWCILAAAKHFTYHASRHLLTVVADLNLSFGPHLMRFLELYTMALAVRSSLMLDIGLAPSTFLLFSCLPYLFVQSERWLTLFVGSIWPLRWLHLRLHMCRVNIVVDVALAVTHGCLIASEAPISIHYELVLVDASF